MSKERLDLHVGNEGCDNGSDKGWLRCKESRLFSRDLARFLTLPTAHRSLPP